MSLKAWLDAARLRTLPLAIAGIGLGSAFAAISDSGFRPLAFWMCLAVAISLQILSNFANDYGDYFGGADHDNRKGPKRQLQLGTISPAQMKKAMTVLVVIVAILVLGTLYILEGKVNRTFFVFILLAAISIWAAIKYTVGKKAYGYRALGDLFVFLFFGLTAVMGSYFLVAVNPIQLRWSLLLAIFVGCWSVGVLNLNNIRDLDSDRLAGKRTIAILLQEKGARLYQQLLVLGGFLALTIFEFCYFDKPPLYLLLFVVPIGMHLYKVQTLNKEAFNPLLRDLSLLTLLVVIAFSVVHLWA